MEYLITDNGRSIVHFSKEDRVDVSISPLFRTVNTVTKLQFLVNVRFHSFHDSAWFDTLEEAKSWAEAKVR